MAYFPITLRLLITLTAFSFFLVGCGGGDHSLQKIVASLEAQDIYDPEEGDILVEMRVRIEPNPDPDASARGESRLDNLVRVIRLGDWLRVDHNASVNSVQAQEEFGRLLQSHLSHFGSPQAFFIINHDERGIQCELPSYSPGHSIHFDHLAGLERSMLNLFASHNRIPVVVAKTQTQAVIEIRPDRAKIVAEKFEQLRFGERMQYRFFINRQSLIPIPQFEMGMAFDIGDEIRLRSRWAYSKEESHQVEFSDYRYVHAIDKTIPHWYSQVISLPDGEIWRKVSVELLRIELPDPAEHNLVDVFDEDYEYYRSYPQPDGSDLRMTRMRAEALRNLPVE